MAPHSGGLQVIAKSKEQSFPCYFTSEDGGGRGYRGLPNSFYNSTYLLLFSESCCIEYGKGEFSVQWMGDVVSPI